MVNARKVIGDERRERRSCRWGNGEDTAMKGEGDIRMGKGERLCCNGYEWDG